MKIEKPYVWIRPCAAADAGSGDGTYLIFVILPELEIQKLLIIVYLWECLELGCHLGTRVEQVAYCCKISADADLSNALVISRNF